MELTPSEEKTIRRSGKLLKNSRFTVALCVFCIVFFVGAIGFRAWYVRDCAHAADKSVSAMVDSDNVRVSGLTDYELWLRFHAVTACHLVGVYFFGAAMVAIMLFLHRVLVRQSRAIGRLVARLRELGELELETEH